MLFKKHKTNKSVFKTLGNNGPRQTWKIGKQAREITNKDHNGRENNESGDNKLQP